MSTLNIMCVICSEFYASSDVVHSTGCGHLFHKKCLDRWLKTSRTCPECRNQYNALRAHRVYLNFGESTEFDKVDIMTGTYPEWRVQSASLVDGVLVNDPPYKPLQSGVDMQGNKVYVARCPISEDVVPANYVPSKNCAYLPWNCEGHKMPLDEVEYLVDDGTYSWVAASDGVIPQHAVVVGYAAGHYMDVENLYTGRAQFNGITYPGKIHPSHKVLYMPCEGREEHISEYEVLVRIPQQREEKQADNNNQISETTQSEAMHINN